MRGDFKLMSYTTTYTIDSYSDVNSLLTCTVSTLFNGQVTATRTITVTLPVDALNRVLSDRAQIDLIIQEEIRRRIPHLDQQVPPNIVNINEIYKLTTAVEAAVEGRVLTALGTPVEGVRVTTLADPTGVLTDSDGAYALQAQSTGSDIVTVQESALYLAVIKPISIYGATQCNIQVRARAGLRSSQVITSATTQENTVTNTARTLYNAQVILPAGAVVDANGVAQDELAVGIANTVTTDTGFVDSFPGLFLGQVGSATPVPIESYGYIDVDLYNPTTGEAYELGVGQTATIQMPVNPDPVGEDSIDVWRLDPVTGIWEYKTTATRIGTSSVFEMTVDSFSTYNLDKALTTTQTLTIKAYNDASTIDGSGTNPAAGVEVTVDMTTGWYGTGYSLWQGRGVTNALGELIIEAPPGYLNVKGKKGTDEYNGFYYDTDLSGNSSVNIFRILPPLPVPPPPPPIETVVATLASVVSYGTPLSQMTMVDATGIVEGHYFGLTGPGYDYQVTTVQGNIVIFTPDATFTVGVHVPNVTEFTFQPG